VYDKSTVKAIRRYKFGKAKFIAPFLTEFVIDCYYENEMDVDLVTFVPISVAKFKERGFNQAGQIAQHFVKSVNLPLLDCLDKIVQPDDTAKLNRQQRFEAVKGVMKVKNNIKDQIKSKSILLIDDVFTTGATANECSILLREAGATRVIVLTVATGKGLVQNRKWTQGLEELL
jgi:ComF family protein